MEYSKDFLMGLYRSMLRIRLCEESLVAPILQGEIKCPVHLCTGQEAVSVGVCSALNQADYIFGNHRSHGHFIAKGGSIKELIAEIYGKSDGCSRGRGGSMHIIDPDVGMLGSAPIVAGTISLALGAALAIKIRGESRVSVSFFGDGATNEGALAEAMNFAALKKLPLIFVCENNFYATHMPILECRTSKSVAGLAKPLGIEQCCIDGNDVLEVFEAAQKAVSDCRNGKGPVFIEALTYRMRGHVGPDDNIQGLHTDIRPPEEVAMWREKDPITSLEKRLFADHDLDESVAIGIKIEAMNEIQEAHNHANSSPYPQESELSRYVFK